jgi:hypothetical protein
VFGDFRSIVGDVPGTSLTAVVRQAVEADASSIASICSTAYRDAYRNVLPPGYIERSVHAFYNEPRVADDIAPSLPDWFGYLVAEETDAFWERPAAA